MLTWLGQSGLLTLTDQGFKTIGATDLSVQVSHKDERCLEVPAFWHQDLPECKVCVRNEVPHHVGIRHCGGASDAIAAPKMPILGTRAATSPTVTSVAIISPAPDRKGWLMAIGKPPGPG